MIVISLVIENCPTMAKKEPEFKPRVGSGQDPLLRWMVRQVSLSSECL